MAGSGGRHRWQSQGGSHRAAGTGWQAQGGRLRPCARALVHTHPALDEVVENVVQLCNALVFEPLVFLFLVRAKDSGECMARVQSVLQSVEHRAFGTV